MNKINQIDLFQSSQTRKTSQQKKTGKLAGQFKKAACLFSSSGIGELGIVASGIEIICANELIPERVELYKENYQTHNIIEGDIWGKKEEIINFSKKQLNENEELFLLYATPPCQGMSSNGMGKLKSEIAIGRRLEEDPRNRLIIPTIEVIVQLNPQWVLLENVPGMRHTLIKDENGSVVNIIEYMKQKIGHKYVGRAEVIACEDYGIPQKRKRLITIYTRDPKGIEFFHENGGSFFSKDMKVPIKTLRDAIGHLPPLDGIKGLNQQTDFHEFHYVNELNPRKYWWVKHTKMGTTAFNNQCVNHKCLYQGNQGQKDIIKDGKCVSDNSIPIYCEICGELLPRPTVIEKNGSVRLMKGFHSAYRRMNWDEPARTLTQNFLYEASDNKLHPEQNRVLSIYEALIIQSIDKYGYKFQSRGKKLTAPKIAEVIGESVPPYLIEKICKMMIEVSS